MFKLLICSVLAVGALLVLVACSSGGDEARQDHWLSLLALIPDTEAGRAEVAMHDHAQFRGLFEIERPASDATEAELREYMQELFSAGGLGAAEILSLANNAPALVELCTELGFTIADVDIDVSAGRPIPITYEIVKGRLSELTVETALRTDPSYSDFLEEASYNGADYFHWGSEGLQVGPLTGVRPLGRGHQLAIFDDTLFWTAQFEDIEDMLDARHGNLPSLADVEDFQLLAEALDEIGTYTAFFSSDTSYLSAVSLNERDYINAEEFALEIPLLPYGAYATGAGLDEDGEYTVFVLAHDDASSANENVLRLRQRLDETTQTLVSSNNDEQLWSDTLDDAQIESRERIVTAKLYGNAERYLWRALSLDSLLVHE